MQKFDITTILDKFDFDEFKSKSSAIDNLDVFNPYDNSLIVTLPSDSISSQRKKLIAWIDIVRNKAIFL